MKNIKRIINLAVRATNHGLNINVDPMTNDTVGRHYNYAIGKVCEFELNKEK